MVQGSRFLRLRRLFKYGIVRGEILPPDARVNPESFPEDEYPICCPKCDYLLRGLPQQRCPECGRDFERGRLLVEQYVIEDGQWQRKHLRRRNRKLETVGLLLCLGYPVVVCLGLYRVGPAAPTSLMVPVLVHSCWVVAAIGLVMILGSNATWIWAWSIDREKRRRVYEAIDRTTPSFRTPREVQRAYRILIVVSASVVIGLMCWALWVE